MDFGQRKSRKWYFPVGSNSTHSVTHINEVREGNHFLGGFEVRKLIGRNTCEPLDLVERDRQLTDEENVSKLGSVVTDGSWIDQQ